MSKYIFTTLSGIILSNRPLYKSTYNQAILLSLPFSLSVSSGLFQPAVSLSSSLVMTNEGRKTEDDRQRIKK
jgi:hypothetical protein